MYADKTFDEYEKSYLELIDLVNVKQTRVFIQRLQSFFF